MTITDLLSLVRYQTYVTSWQMDDDELMIYLNMAYHDLENTIVTDVDENFFYQKWKTNLIDWQNEYTFQESSATSEWFKKILQIEVRRDEDQDDYVVLPHKNIQLFNSARDVLESITPESWGFYDIKDSSIFIYPTPTEDVANGLILSGTVNLIDLTTTNDAEIYIFPDHTDLRQFIPLIALWAKQYVYQARGMLNEKNDAKNEFEIEKRKMVKFLSNRDNDAMEVELPNSDIYK